VTHYTSDRRRGGRLRGRVRHRRRHDLDPVAGHHAALDGHADAIVLVLLRPRHDSSTADFFRVKVVGATTSTVLQEVGSTANDDAVWATSSANLNAFAGQTVRIHIETVDASTASLVEAGWMM
jgi:hypothetical protein